MKLINKLKILMQFYLIYLSKQAQLDIIYSMIAWYTMVLISLKLLISKLSYHTAI